MFSICRRSAGFSPWANDEIAAATSATAQMSFNLMLGFLLAFVSTGKNINELQFLEQALIAARL
jgi:hypothetical protein